MRRQPTNPWARLLRPALGPLSRTASLARTGRNGREAINFLAAVCIAAAVSYWL
jgi:hypothetical protein